MEQVAGVIRDLVRLQFFQEQPGDPLRYSYFPRSDEQNEMMRLIDDAYRRDLVPHLDHGTFESVFPCPRVRPRI